MIIIDKKNIDEMLPSVYTIIRKLYDEMTLWGKIKWNISCFFSDISIWIQCKWFLLLADKYTIIENTDFVGIRKIT